VKLLYQIPKPDKSNSSADAIALFLRFTYNSNNRKYCCWTNN